MVRDGRGLPGLPGLAALAGRFRLRSAGMSTVGAGGRPVQMRRAAAADVGDRGHDVRPKAHAVDGVVPRVLDVRPPRTVSPRWACSARFRSGPTRPRGRCCTGCVRCWCGRAGNCCPGRVEVDETYIGGEEAGLAGGRAKGKKALVAVAVEVKPPKGFGRCRMRVIPDGSASVLHTFITDNVAPGSTVITDGWSGYLGIDKVGYTHDRRSQRAAKALGEDIGKLLPGVHRVASLAKRWLLGTVIASNVPFGSGASSRSSSKAHLPTSACSRSQARWPGIRPVIRERPPGGAVMSSRFPAAFRAAGLSLLGYTPEIPATEFGSPYGRLTGARAPDPDLRR